MKYVNYIIAILIIGGGIWAFVSQQKDDISSDPKLPPAMSSTDGPQEAPGVKKKTTTLTDKSITTKEGMKIEIIKEGTGEAIKSGQTATVDYVGSLTDGKVFDASRNHGTTGFSFPLGAGQVIKGWDQGVVGMKVGEVRKLTIPSDLAYGANGIPGVIPGGATLVFEVTLLSFK
jgi:FKBP-type peptidyl-prolyl cis-trans isomerase